MIYPKRSDHLHARSRTWVVSADATPNECVGEDINGIDLSNTFDRSQERNEAAQIKGQDHRLVA
jgi:hypothetical protein